MSLSAAQGDDRRHGSRFAILSGAIVWAVGAIAIQVPIVNRGFVSMDEGHLVATAQRLLEGDLLYRDIQTGIFPGVYYLAALLFEMFGMDVVVTRWAQVGVNTSIAVILWFVGLRMMQLRWAALAPLAFIAFIPVAFPVFTMLNYSTISLALGLFALLFLLRYVEGARRRDAVICGFALALCALTKQNFGALAGFAILVGFLWGRPESPLGSRSLAKGLMPIVLAGGRASLVAIAIFVRTGTFDDLIQHTFTRLVSTQAESFYHPIPPVLGEHPQGDGLFTFFYSPAALFGYLVRGESPLSPGLYELTIRLSYGLPLAALFVAPFVLFRTRSTDRPAERRASRIAVVFASVFFLGIFPSSIWSHLAFVLPPILVVMFWIGERVSREIHPRAPATGRMFFDLCLGVVVVFALMALRIPDDIRRWHSTALDLPRASVYVPPEQATLYRAAAEFVETCAGPEDPIFVAPIHPLLYFVTDRRNPTRYDLTIPGDVDGKLIVRDLEASRTRCVVYDPEMYPEFPPFDELFPRVSQFFETGFQKVPIPGPTRSWDGLTRARED
ncbi:MAG: glycosyltransferase family 39 protein [Myxococcota bacterium]|nr:glycosyltransferase family 39 protein [Myxococcota bacterium]